MSVCLVEEDEEKVGKGIKIRVNGLSVNTWTPDTIFLQLQAYKDQCAFSHFSGTFVTFQQNRRASLEDNEFEEKKKSAGVISPNSHPVDGCTVHIKHGLTQTKKHAAFCPLDRGGHDFQPSPGERSNRKLLITEEGECDPEPHSSFSFYSHRCLWIYQGGGEMLDAAGVSQTGCDQQVRKLQLFLHSQVERWYTNRTSSGQKQLAHVRKLLQSDTQVSVPCICESQWGMEYKNNVNVNKQ